MIYFNFSLSQSSLVSSGLSLNSSTVKSIKEEDGSGGSGVRCILSLSNWSMFTLLDVETNTECGETSELFPPRNIFPGYREVMVMQNTNPWVGTCGTISWQVRSHEISGENITHICCPECFLLFSLFPLTFCVTQRAEFS